MGDINITNTSKAFKENEQFNREDLVFCLTG